MIKDNIKNAKKYYSISENMELGFKFIEENDLENFECGKHKIKGDEVFAMVQEYDTKLAADAKFEVHKKYIDIQFMIKNSELMGYGDVSNFEYDGEFDFEKDIVFLNLKLQAQEPEFLHVKQNEFVIFTPSDAHMPSIALDKPAYAKKVIVKVAI